MKYRLFIVVYFLLISACDGNDALPQVAKIDAHQKDAIIHVNNSSMYHVTEAIREHSELTKAVQPKEYLVKLELVSAGGINVIFPNGVTPYAFTNLIGWLNQSLGSSAASGALGWMTSPATGDRYYLIPEESNSWGDTLIGSTSEGIPVRVYLPDTGLSKMSERFAYVQTPVISPSSIQSTAEFTIILDADLSFGNHGFEITNTIDYRWSP